MTKTKYTLYTIAYCFLVAFLCSCSKVVPPYGLSSSEAHEKFLKICEEEFQLKPKIIPVRNTVWIYLPLKEDIIGIKGSKKGPQSSNQASEKFSIKYLNVAFNENCFNIEYDIALNKTYLKDYGYSSIYTESYRKKQSNILSAIYRAYSDIGKIPGDVEYLDSAKDISDRKLVDSYVPTDDAPEFIAFVIADIVTGIEIETIVYFEDLRKIMAVNPSLSSDEYLKRYITDLRGNASIVDDETGEHLEYKKIILPEFLAKQIVNRLRIKYERSAFPPSEDSRAEILAIVNATIKNYNFKNFDSILLRDLNNNSEEKIGSEQLSQYDTNGLPPGGKLHVIEFF